MCMRIVRAEQRAWMGGERAGLQGLCRLQVAHLGQALLGQLVGMTSAVRMGLGAGEAAAPRSHPPPAHQQILNQYHAKHTSYHDKVLKRAGPQCEMK